jgi:hypothetical protein
VGEIETLLNATTLSLEFVLGGSAGKENAKDCLLQLGPEAQPQNMIAAINVGKRRVIVLAVSPFATAGEAIC